MIRTLNSLKFYFSSKPLPTGLYYPVMDVRTHDTHIYHDKIKSFSNHLQLKENIVDGKVQKYKENTIHQGQFKQFLLGQIKDDFSLLTKSKEIIFAGRSNAGKSSLINSLLGKKKLALVSKKTGSTQKLRFYELDKNWGYLVDSPGYGYSYINVLAQQKNQGMLLDYLKISTRCIRLYLLIRADDGIQINDMAFLYRTQPYKINTQIVLTKCDKLKEEQLNDRILSIGLQLRRFKHVNPIIHATSTTENLGIQELKCSIIDSLLFHKQRNIPDEYEESVVQYLEKHYRLKAGHLDKKTLEYYTKIKPMKQLMAQEQRKQLAGAYNKSIKILKK